VRPLRLTAHVFKMSERIGIISGTLQRHFVLDTSVNSNLINVLHKMAPHGEFSVSDFDFDYYYYGI